MKNKSITFTLNQTCRACWVWVTFLRPIAKTWPLFGHHSRKSKFHHLWQCSLKSFLKRLNGRHALYWHQHEFVSCLQSAGAAHIWLWHDACPNVWWESHWNSNVLGDFTNGQTTIGTNHFPTFWIFSSFFYIVGRKCSLSSVAVWPSFERWYRWWVCVLLTASFPNACFNISKVS